MISLTHDVTVVGRVACDDWVLGPELASELMPHHVFGGSAGNIAVHLARYGIRIALVTEFGLDELSRRYIARLQAHGIDLSCSNLHGRDIAHCQISPGQYYRWLGGYDGRKPHLSTDLIARAFELSSNVLYTDVLPDHAPRTISAIKRSSYWLPQLALNESEKEVRDALQLSWSAVFANTSEREQIEDIAGLPIRELSLRRPDTLWITTHEAEATEVWAEGKVQWFPVPAAPCLVPVGGGDAFLAGYLARSLRSASSLSARVSSGHTLAAQVVAQVGCQLA